MSANILSLSLEPNVGTRPRKVMMEVTTIQTATHSLMKRAVLFYGVATVST